MTNPISDPFVENVISADVTAAPVALAATQDGVARVTLNRPHAQNAFDGPSINALTEIIETLQGAEGVRIVFLQGAGGQFSAGHDHDWMRMGVDWSEDDNRDDALATAAMLKALNDIPALTVALVEGSATGTGAGLVAACDMAIATSDATFAFTEVKLGLVPATVSPYVIRAVGARQAVALFATGHEVDAAHARAIGLVQGVVADSAALDAARDALSAQIKSSGPQAVDAIKQLVRHVAGQPLSHGLIEDTAKRQAKARFSQEGREGMAAVLAQRKPSWAQG